MGEGPGVNGRLRARGIGDQRDMGMGLLRGGLRLLLLLLLPIAFAMLPLLLGAVAFRCLLLLKVGVIPFALDSADFLGRLPRGRWLHH